MPQGEADRDLPSVHRTCPRPYGPGSAAILLATYNGSRFLPAFLESLSGQAFRYCVIYWRDDGSTDGTVEMLRCSAMPFPIVEIPHRGRLGPCQGFLNILREAAGHHGSYHFADQDDVWNHDKIAVAHAQVASRTVPVMIHGRQLLIDSGGDVIGLSDVPGPASFENALVENIAVGCSIAFNDAAARLGAQGSRTHALMHDWWMYLMVTCFGEVIFDSEPRIQYRQHAANVVGMRRVGLQELYRKFHRHFSRLRGPSPIVNQAQDLVAIHGKSMAPAQLDLIQSLIHGKTSFRARISLALRPPVHRQSQMDDILLRLVLLSGRY